MCEEEDSVVKPVTNIHIKWQKVTYIFILVLLFFFFFFIHLLLLLLILSTPALCSFERKMFRCGQLSLHVLYLHLYIVNSVSFLNRVVYYTLLHNKKIAFGWFHTFCAGLVSLVYLAWNSFGGVQRKCTLLHFYLLVSLGQYDLEVLFGVVK